jgi:hypothetical protein
MKFEWAIGLFCLVTIGLFILSIYLYREISKRLKAKKENIDLQLLENDFHTSTRIDYKLNYSMQIDEANNKIACCNYGSDIYKIFQFSELTGCEIFIDDKTIKGGGVGRNLVGGAIAGAAGVLIAESTRKEKVVIDSLRISIFTNKIQDPVFSFEWKYDQGVERSNISHTIEFAEKVQAIIRGIVSKNTNR